MNVRAAALALLLFVHAGLFAVDAAAAADADAIPGQLGGALIKMPQGFDGPRRSHPNSQSTLDVYVSAPGQPAALVQLSWIHIPWVKDDVPEADRVAGASSFLDGTLAKVSKNVPDWTRTAAEPVTLGGFKGVRARWSGQFRGAPATGTMYFVVLGKDSYNFHVLGQSEVPNPGVAAAIAAIERVQLTRGAPAVRTP